MLIRTEKLRTLYKSFILLVKYIPPVSTILLVMHAIVCLNGYNDWILCSLARVSIFRAFLMLLASHAFGFCWIHRNFVYYNLIVSLLITFHHSIGLGIFLRPCEIVSSIIGVGLITLLIEHWKGYTKCNGNIKETYKWTLEKDY